MCLSAYSRQTLANERARISAVVVKITLCTFKVQFLDVNPVISHAFTSILQAADEKKSESFEIEQTGQVNGNLWVSKIMIDDQLDKNTSGK